MLLTYIFSNIGHRMEVDWTRVCGYVAFRSKNSRELNPFFAVYSRAV